MAKTAKYVKALLIALCVCLMSVSLIACGGGASSSESNADGVSISMQTRKNEIKKGETLDIIVLVEGAEDTSYVITTDNDVLFVSRDGVATVTTDVYEDVVVKVTATANADTTKSVSKNITVKKNANAPVEEKNVSVSISTRNHETGASSQVLRKTENGKYLRLDIRVSVTTEGIEDDSYTLSTAVLGGSSTPVADLVSLGSDADGDYIQLIGTVSVDTTVRLTATSNAMSTKYDSIDLTIRPESKSGATGELTSAAIAEIGSSNITVSGTLVDVVKRTGSNASRTSYDILVKMTETKEDETVTAGRWFGKWNITGQNIVDEKTYVMGSDGLLTQHFINKDNQVESKNVIDSSSNTATWESMHYWNHLGQLDVSKFEYDEENDYYKYNIEAGYWYEDPYFIQNVYYPSDDEYLMSYLAFSLTPLLNENFAEFYVYLDPVTKKISKVEAKTATVDQMQTDDEGNETKVGEYYTIVTLYFSDIGTTVVDDPAPYEAPTNTEELDKFNKFASALENMKDMDSYSFKMIETNTYSPTIDSSDYEISGTVDDAISGSTGTTVTYDGTVKPYNYTSATGDVGFLGAVTANYVLINETGEYTSYFDNPYHTEAFGYKDNGNGTYEEFEYKADAFVIGDVKKGGLVGTRIAKGSLKDALPAFDLSPYVFEFDSSKRLDNGKWVYTFTLRDSTIIRSVAEQLVFAEYAKDAASSIQSKLAVSINEDGVITSINFPYSYASGTYSGYYETAYYNINNTTIDASYFGADKYVPRVVPTSWADLTVNDYFVGDQTHIVKPANEVLGIIFGFDASEADSKLPTPDVFCNIFDDNLFGPWYNTKTIDENTERGILSFTARSEHYDENYRVSNYDEIEAGLKTAMAQKGYALDDANCGVSGGDRYLSFINETDGIQIVVDNNYTRYFWITVYHLGDWTLRK